MKVLILSAHFSPNVGGVETHLDDLVAALTRRGIEVFVLTYRPLTTNVRWRMWEKGRNLKILRIPWLPGLFYKLVNTPVFEFLYLLPGIFLFTPLVLLIQKPDVIHSHGLIAGFVAVFWGKIFGKKIITTTHSIYNFPKKGGFRNFAKWIFENSDKVLTLSEQSRSEILGLGVNGAKIKTFTYWIDLKVFKKLPNAKSRLSWNKKFVVFFVGRLVAEKGINELLEAVSLWDKDVFLAIAGSGPLEKTTKEMGQRIKNIIFLGRIKNSDLPLYYSAADLLVVPSVHEEGFGRVILESVACGTPVLASNRGAIPEAMDEKVGMLIDITPKNIADAVDFLYKNKKLLKAKKSVANGYARRRFSESNVEIIISQYDKQEIT